MARTKLRPGPVGFAFMLFDIWRRLPPKQRKQVMMAARRHGPKAAAKLYAMRRFTRPPS